MRLPGCTRPVPGRSSRRIIRRGAKFMKDTPRSGSRVSTAPTRKRARPSSIVSPGRTLSSAIMRSAKKATLATPPTASTSARASTCSSPARQSRSSIRKARRRIALALAVDAAGDEPDLAGAAGGDRVVVGYEHQRGVRFRVHLEHEVDHARAGRSVEISGWLVRKEELPLNHE